MIVKVYNRYAPIRYEMNSLRREYNGEVHALNHFALGKKVIDISLSSSGRQMAVISKDRNDRYALQLLEAQELPDTWYVSINWMMNSPMRSVCMADKAPYIVVASDNSTLSFLEPNPFDGVVHTEWMKKYNTSTLRSAALAGSGAFVLAGCEDGTIFAYNTKGENIWRCTLGSSVEALSISAREDLIFAGCNGGDLAAISPSGEICWEYHHSAPLQSLALSLDGQNCIAGYGDGKVLIFECKKSNPALSFDLDKPPEGISYSKNGEMALLWSSDRCILMQKDTIIWDGRLAAPSGSPLIVRNAQLFPDGRNFVVGASDGSSERLVFYSVTTCQEKRAAAEASATLEAGTSLYKQGDYKGALSLFMHAESLVGPSLTSTFYRGQTLLQLKETKNAEDLFLKCLRHEGAQERETFMIQGIAALHLKKEKEAFDLFKQAASLARDDTSAQYALAVTKHLISNREIPCPPPLDDCMVAGLPIDLSPFILPNTVFTVDKCFLIPCRAEALEMVTRKGLYLNQVEKGIDTGYDIKKGDVGVVIDIIEDRILGPFEAAGYPQIRKPMPGTDPAEFIRSKKNVLAIRLKKPEEIHVVQKASEILKSNRIEVMISRNGEPYVTHPVVDGDACADILYHFGLAEKAVQYPGMNEIVSIVGGNLAGAKARVKGINRGQGTVMVELCDVSVAVPIMLNREMVAWKRR